MCLFCVNAMILWVALTKEHFPSKAQWLIRTFFSTWCQVEKQCIICCVHTTIARAVSHFEMPHCPPGPQVQLVLTLRRSRRTACTCYMSTYRIYQGLDFSAKTRRRDAIFIYYTSRSKRKDAACALNIPAAVRKVEMMNLLVKSIKQLRFPNPDRKQESSREWNEYILGGWERVGWFGSVCLQKLLWPALDLPCSDEQQLYANHVLERAPRGLDPHHVCVYACIHHR